MYNRKVSNQTSTSKVLVRLSDLYFGIFYSCLILTFLAFKLISKEQITNCNGSYLGRNITHLTDGLGPTDYPYPSYRGRKKGCDRPGATPLYWTATYIEDETRKCLTAGGK